MTHFYISFSGPHNPFFLAEVCFETNCHQQNPCLCFKYPCLNGLLWGTAVYLKLQLLRLKIKTLGGEAIMYVLQADFDLV